MCINLGTSVTIVFGNYINRCIGFVIQWSQFGVNLFGNPFSNKMFLKHSVLLLCGIKLCSPYQLIWLVLTQGRAGHHSCFYFIGEGVIEYYGIRY